MKAKILSRLKGVRSVLIDRVKQIEVEMTAVNVNSGLQIKISQGTSLEMITASIVTLNVCFQKYVKQNERS